MKKKDLSRMTKKSLRDENTGRKRSAPMFYEEPLVPVDKHLALLVIFIDKRYLEAEELYGGMYCDGYIQ